MKINEDGFRDAALAVTDHADGVLVVAFSLDDLREIKGGEADGTVFPNQIVAYTNITDKQLLEVIAGQVKRIAEGV